jgi:hypothetical protein
MKVIFDYNVPAEFVLDKMPDVMIRVEAEILNLGTATETVFLRNISGTGLNMLWALQTSDALFLQVQQHAGLVARNELQHLSLANAIPLSDDDMKAKFGFTANQAAQIFEATRVHEPENQN